MSQEIGYPTALLRPYLGRFLALLGIICVAAAVEAVGLILLSALLSALLDTRGSVSALLFLEHANQYARTNPHAFLLLLVAVYMIKSLLTLGSTYASFSLSLRITDDCRMRLVKDFLHVPFSRLDNRQGGMLQMVLDEPGIVAFGLGAGGVLLQNLLSTLSVYVALFYVSPLVTLGLTVIGLAAVVTLWTISRYSLRIGEHRSVSYRDSYSYFAEMLSAVKQFRMFGLENQAEKQAASHLAHMHGIQLKLNMIAASPRVLVEMIFLLGLAVTIVMLTPRVGEASVLSALGLAVAATVRLLPSFSASASTWVHVQQAWPAMSNIAHELGRLECFDGVPGMKTGAVYPVSFRDRIEFHDVVFSHPGRTSALAGIKLRIRCGTFVAIVGPSGAGKSTFVDLLCGFYTPDAGQICVDGVDLCKISLSSWREQLGVVLQDGFLLNGTIRENLCVLRPNCSEQLMRETVALVGADTFIRDLPEGYNTRVGERGVQLSGGQRQRLALARALIRQPKILILDEAMSALDLESEETLQNALECLRGRMTMIVIAHRLSAVRKADIIYVLERGKVIESGCHAALLSDRGLYATMWMAARPVPNGRAKKESAAREFPTIGCETPEGNL